MKEHISNLPDGALEVLLRKLQEARARNPNVSLRAFAKKLGVSSGALSEMLQGKRPISVAVRRKMADRLLLSPNEVMTVVQGSLPERMGLKPDERLILSQDQFKLISDWWYFGLLNLLKTRGFKNNLTWMAQRLGITVQAVSEAWERLLRLGHLEQNGSQVRRKHPHIKTTDQLADLSIRKAHIGDLALIEKSMLDLPLDYRDNTSCVFAVDIKDLPKAKEMLRIFQTQFLSEIGKDTGDEVYKLSIHLYPLTQVRGPGKPTVKGGH